MANKQIHRVSPELTNDAQFKSIESIPTTMLQDGDTILVYPGVYSDPRTANIGNVMVEGFGNSDNVIFNGFSVLSDMPASSTVDLKNVKVQAPGIIVGNSAVTVNIADCTIDGTTGISFFGSSFWFFLCSIHFWFFFCFLASFSFSSLISSIITSSSCCSLVSSMYARMISSFGMLSRIVIKIYS